MFLPIYELDVTLDILQEVDAQVFSVALKSTEAKKKKTSFKKEEETPQRMGPK